MTQVNTTSAQRMVLEHLKIAQAVTGLAGSRIYAGRDEPPAGYTPTNGGCVLVKQRGEQFRNENEQLVASMQVQCIAATEEYADALYRVVRGALHHQPSQYLRYCELEQGGAHLRKPETGWPFVLAFFEVIVV